MFIHHKFLKHELIKDDLNLTTEQHVVTFNRNKTKFFKSKCLYYIRLKHIDSFVDLKSFKLIGTKDILKFNNVRFLFEYDRYEKKIKNLIIKVVEEDVEYPFSHHRWDIEIKTFI